MNRQTTDFIGSGRRDDYIIRGQKDMILSEIDGGCYSIREIHSKILILAPALSEIIGELITDGTLVYHNGGFVTRKGKPLSNVDAQSPYNAVEQTILEIIGDGKIEPADISKLTNLAKSDVSTTIRNLYEQGVLCFLDNGMVKRAPSPIPNDGEELAELLS